MSADKNDSKRTESQSELQTVAAEELERLRRSLEKELGREPTEAEVDEWLREHTESF